MDTTPDNPPILLGNSFPFPLVRRPMRAEPLTVEAARILLRGRQVESFWGHPNTLRAAIEILGVDVTPSTVRPALELNAAGFPCLNGISAKDVLILCPEYAPGFRPAIGQELTTHEIRGFHAVLLAFS